MLFGYLRFSGDSAGLIPNRCLVIVDPNWMKNGGGSGGKGNQDETVPNKSLRVTSFGNLWQDNLHLAI